MKKNLLLAAVMVMAVLIGASYAEDKCSNEKLVKDCNYCFAWACGMEALDNGNCDNMDAYLTSSCTVHFTGTAGNRSDFAMCMKDKGWSSIPWDN